MILTTIKDLESKIQEYLETNRDLAKIERKWGIKEAAQPGCLRDCIKNDIHVYSVIDKYLLESMHELIEFSVNNELIETEGSQVQNILNVLISDEDVSTSWSDEIITLYLNDQEHANDPNFLIHGAAFAIEKFDPTDLITKSDEVMTHLLKGFIAVRKKFIESFNIVINENIVYLTDISVYHGDDV